MKVRYSAAGVLVILLVAGCSGMVTGANQFATQSHGDPQPFLLVIDFVDDVPLNPDCVTVKPNGITKLQGCLFGADVSGDMDGNAADGNDFVTRANARIGADGNGRAWGTGYGTGCIDEVTCGTFRSNWKAEVNGGLLTPVQDRWTGQSDALIGMRVMGDVTSENGTLYHLVGTIELRADHDDDDGGGE